MQPNRDTPEPCQFEGGCFNHRCRPKGYCMRRRHHEHATPAREWSWRIDAAIANAKYRSGGTPLARLVDELLDRPEAERSDTLGVLASALRASWYREQIRARRKFRVVGGPMIAWDSIEPYAHRVLNHFGRPLEQMDEKLTVSEVIDVLLGAPWGTTHDGTAEELIEIVARRDAIFAELARPMLDMEKAPQG